MSPLRHRLGQLALLLIVLLAQLTFFPQVRLFGVVPDVMIVAVAAVAVREGPDGGAVFGFVAGVSIDLFLEVPVGLSALAYSVVGYGVGLLQTGLLRSTWWLAPALGGSASLVGGLIFVLTALILGQEHLFAIRTFVIVPTRALYDAVLALAVFPLANRLLGPGDDELIPHDDRVFRS